MIEFETYGGLSEEELASLEEQLGIALPDEYRAFLAETNGADAVETGYLPGTDFGVETLFGVDPDQGWRDLVGYVSILEGRIPPGTLPIGGDDFGNVFLLSLDGPRQGTVWFWNHELESEEDEEPNWDNISHVEDSFTSLLQRLEPR